MPRARLFSPLGALAGVSVEVDDEATVGRDRGHAVVIDDGLISKDHARIAFDSATGGFLLEDLGSTNGTALDGVPVVGRERLDHLHVITFAGRHEFVFQDLLRTRERHGSAPVPTSSRPGGADGTPITEPIAVTQAHEPFAVPQALIERMDTPEGGEAGAADSAGAVERTQFHELPLAVPSGIRPAASLAPEAPEAAAHGVDSSADLSAADRGPADRGPAARRPPIPGSPTVFVLEVDFETGPERFPLVYGSNQIGRTATAAIRLASDHISRRHAVMKVGATITLRDQGSNNHTFLAGKPIAGEVEIEPGDVLSFGPLAARVLRADSAGNESMPGGSYESR